MKNDNDRRILLDVLLASKLYLAIKSTPKNPFVKNLRDETHAEQEALKILQECVNEASHISPEEELMKYISEEENRSE